MAMPFRFIHAADLHLDSPFKGMDQVPQAVRTLLLDAAFRALDRLVDTAVGERVDFVLLAGDTYDMADRSLRAQLRFQRALQRLSDAGIQVFIIYGNHDPGDGKRADLDMPAGVHVFPPGRLASIEALGRSGEPAAEICGYSYPTAAVSESVIPGFKALPPASLFRIGLLHANLDGVSGHDNYAPCSKSDLAQCDIRYWALGHIHHRTVVQERPHIVYPGNLQGRHIRETGAKGCYLADVDAAGEVALEFRALDVCRWAFRELAIDKIANEQELKDAMDAAVRETGEQAGGRAAVLRLKLTGRGELHRLLRQPSWVNEWAADYRDQAAGLAEIGEPFVWLESIRTETGYAADPEQIAREESFLGDLWRLSERLLDEPPELLRFAEETAAPLLARAGAGPLIRTMLDREAGDWLKRAREMLADRLTADE